jgi:hypothetical protein
MTEEAARTSCKWQSWVLRGICFGITWWVVAENNLANAQAIKAGVATTALGEFMVVRQDGIEERLSGQATLPLFESDVVRTGAGGQALIELANGSQVALNENTEFMILSRWEKGKGTTRILRLSAGEIWVRTAGAGPARLEVETPVATAAIRETEFNLKVQPDGETTLTVVQGVVEFGTAFGTCPIKPGTISYGKRGKKCTKPAPTETAPAIAWVKVSKPQQ